MGVLAKPIPFGDYFLLEKINTGGMAEVYKAKSFGVEGFERISAVKKILPSIAEDSEFISMFVDEAKIAVQLNHANIAQIFNFDCIDDQYYIAMEYVPGRDLRVIYDRCVRNNKKLDIACVCFIISEICKGLDYAHNKKDVNGCPMGIVHRDISPQNILISYDGECKLIDFGIAKASNKSSATQVGILKGKFSYMSPEQVSGKTKIDCRSDIFALGIVLFEMLTLRRLFLGSSDFSTLEKIRKVEVSPPTLYNPDIPDDLEEIVLRALEKDVNARYQSAAELQEALQRFMNRHNLFYTQKDLSAFMGELFAQEIALEQKKNEYYRENYTRAFLEQSKQAAMGNSDNEDETSFYGKSGLPQMSGVQYEPVGGGGQQPQKQAIYADLDNFQPPTSDIVYSAKGSKADNQAFAYTPAQEQPKDESLSELASKPIVISGSMPKARKSLAMDAVIVNNNAKKETLMSVPVSTHNGTSKIRSVFISIVMVLLLVIGFLTYLWFATRYDANDGILAFQIEPNNVVVDIEINGEPIASNGQLLKGKFQLEHLSRRAETRYTIKSNDFEIVEGSKLARNEADVIQIALKPKTARLLITVSEPEATVKIDGIKRDGDNKFEILGLEPGQHLIEISKDRYNTVSEKFEVKQGENASKAFQLTPIYGGLKLISEPDGTIFQVHNKETGETRTIKSGESYDDFIIGEHYEIIFKNGNNTVKYSWKPKADGSLDTHSYVINQPTVPSITDSASEELAADLAQFKNKPAADSSSKTKTTTTATKPAATAAAAPATPKPPKQESAPAPAAANNNTPGIFKINSKPPCEVIINGKSYGMTPKKIDLPAGTYKIRFVNADQGIDQEQTATLEGGTEVKVNRK